MAGVGHKQTSKRYSGQVGFGPQSGDARVHLDMSENLHMTRPQQTSGRTFPAASFRYLSVERPFNKIYRINCRPKLGVKLLDRFFHRWPQVPPPVNYAA